MKKQVDNNHGGALLIVLGIMLMLSIAAIMAVHTAQTDMDLSFNQLHYDQAFYVADAGIKQTLLTLNYDNQWNGAYVDVAFEEGAYTVAVIHAHLDTPVADTVQVRSTGLVEQARANLRATIVPELEYPFVFAMYGEDSIFMDQSTQTDSYNSDIGDYTTTQTYTDGDVASNGTILLDNAAIVGGDVSSATDGGVTVDATCTVYEDVNDDVDSVMLDPIDQERYDEALADNDNLTGMSGDYSLLGIDLTLGTADTCVLTQDSGVYYFNDITMAATSCILLGPGVTNVTIFMTGTLSVENTTSINFPGEPENLLIYSQGDVVVNGNDIIICAAFYGLDADVILENSVEWYGSIIANSCILKNNAEVHYDAALIDKETRTTGRMMIIAWLEE